MASVMGWIDSEERALPRDREGPTEAGVSFQNKLHQCAFKKKKKKSVAGLNGKLKVCYCDILWSETSLNKLCVFYLHHV